MKIGDRVQLRIMWWPTGTIVNTEEGTMMNNVVIIAPRFRIQWDDGETGAVREYEVDKVDATDDQLFSFTFRAECNGDIEALSHLIPEQRVVERKVETFDDGTPDRLCRLTLRGISLPALKRWMNMVRDGHVMVETVAPSDEYTGERTYRY